MHAMRSGASGLKPPKLDVRPAESSEQPKPVTAVGVFLARPASMSLCGWLPDCVDHSICA